MNADNDCGRDRCWTEWGHGSHPRTYVGLAA